jgi:23S rRNA (guanosine2251-2'-O)-methyltransferase
MLRTTLAGSLPDDPADCDHTPMPRHVPPPAKPRTARPQPPSRPAPAKAAPAKPATSPPPSPPASTAGGTWLWGRHAVLGALGNPARKILRLVATADVAAELAEGGDLAGESPHILPKEELAKLLPPSAVHQGLALLTRPLKPVVIEDIVDRAAGLERAAVIVLDQVTDPHNIGAILRSAAAFGALAVIMPDRNAPEVSGTLAKSASGALEHVPLVRVVNLVRALGQLKAAGFWCIGLDGTAEHTLAAQVSGGKACLVLGSEGDGLRRLTRDSCDLMARLPTSGPVASLNVSNAAAIALYELARA